MDNKEKMRDLTARETELNQKIEKAREQFLQAKFKKEHMEDEKAGIVKKLAEKGYDLSTVSETLMKDLRDGIEKCDAIYAAAPIEKLQRWAKDDETLRQMISKWESMRRSSTEKSLKDTHAELEEKSKIVKYLIDVAKSLHDKAVAKEEAYVNQQREIEAKIKAEGVSDMSRVEEYIKDKMSEYEGIVSNVELQMNQLKDIQLK